MNFHSPIRLPKTKAVKQRLWKTLNATVGILTILNVSMVGALVAPRVAQATGTTPTWPTDNQWVIPVCNDDPINDENPDEVDLDSSGAQYGAAYFIDGSNVYFRERVDGDPGTPGNWNQYAWVFMIQKDAATTDYDFLVSLRGSGQGENVELWENTSKNGPIDWSPIFNDPADTQLQTWDTSTNSRRVTTGSDFYVDWQIPLTALTSRGVVVNNGKFSTNHGLFWATATNANNYNKDHLNCYDAPDLRVTKEVSKNGGAYFDDGRQDGVTAAPGDSLKYRVTVTNVGGPTQGSTTVIDELGKNFNDGDGDASHNVNPASQYSAWTATKNLNSDGNGNPFTGAWGDGSADGQPNDTLTLTIPLVSGGGAQEQFTFDAAIRNDLAVGTHLLENLATVGQNNAETDVPVVRVGQCVLEIAKSVNKQTAQPGEELTYTLNYANTGTANCTGGGVRIDDVIPAGTTYVSGSNTQSNQNDLGGDGIDFGFDHDAFGLVANPAGYNPATKLLSWDAEVVSPGESGTVTYKVTVNPVDACKIIYIDNTAKIYADQIPSGVTSNQVRTVVETPCNGDLTVNKYFDDNGDGQIDRTNPQGWTWDLTGGSQNNAGGSSLSLAADDYTVTEDAIVGYSSTWTCSDQTSGQGTSINLTLNPSQDLVCSFTNTRDIGHLVVHKNVLNPDGEEVVDTHAFTVQFDGGNDQTIAEGGTNASYMNLPTGTTYTIEELLDEDYDLVSYSIDLDNQTDGAQVVVSKNNTTHLTVTNKQKKATINIYKDVRDFQGNDTTDPTEFQILWNHGIENVGELTPTSVQVNPGSEYVFTETQVPAYTTMIGEFFVTPKSNETVDITFINWQNPSSVSGSKFDDTNGNGTWDNNEPGLAGWTICLNGANETDEPNCTTTDANGDYSFGPLTPGDYHIWEVNQPGWQQTYPVGNLHAVTLGVNANVTDKDFGNFKLGKISGYKYNDLNGDGDWDQGEPALSGWDIQLSGDAAAVDTTDANGFYEFSNLGAGDYGLQEVQQPGWIQTSANPSDVHVVSGTNSQDNNFGNFQLGSISGRKFDDLNGNGAWDNGEPVIQNWTIYLNDGQNISSTTTDASGVYLFTNLGPDEYTISENLPAGWIQTFPPQDGTYLVTLTSGANVTDKDFGNFKLAKVSGYKWNDTNADGDWDQGELGIQSWKITLSDGQQNWHTWTDPSGYYEFAGLEAGTYSLTEETRAGWTNTTPMVVNGIVATSGLNSQNHNFGNFQLGKIEGYKYDAQENPLSGWTICLAINDQQTCTTTDANGHYSFMNLPYGTYVVSELSQYGWTQIFPAGNGTHTVPVVSGTGLGQVVPTYDFVNRLNDFGVDIEKTAPATVEAGDQLTYTLAWSVSGNIDIDNVVVTDTLPADVAYVSADLIPTSINGQTLTWELGTQSPGSNGVINVTVAVASPLANGTELENTAEICGQGELTVGVEKKEEPTTKCDDDDTTTEVESSLIVDLEKTDSVDPVLAGSELTYTLAWTVSGNAPIDNVILTDVLPEDLTFVSASNGGGYDANTRTVTWNLGPQAPGANGSETITVTVASPMVNGTVLTNSAEVCAESYTRTEQEVMRVCDPDDETTTVESAPSLSIEKTVNVSTFTNPGAVIEYTVTVTNAASATDTARDVILTDILPTGFVFASDLSNQSSFTIGDLAPGESKTVKYLVNISGSQAAGTYDNLATAKGSNTDEVTDIAPVEVRVPQILGDETEPKLTITKVVSTKTAKPGDVLLYTITVKNVGDGDAENVVISDTLPKDLSFVHATGRTMTWNIGTLQPGRTRVLNVDVRVESDAKSGTYTNVAVVSADELTDQKATADVSVRRPTVLGLATTGAGWLDLAIALVGVGLIALGILGFRRRSETTA